MAAGNTLSTASTLTSATFTTATATPASASTSTSTSAPSFQESMIRSTEVWQNDLESLFHGAKDRFPDVVWEVGEDEDHVEEVWGHKAIVYARAPPSFQSRYFKAPGALGLDMSMALSRTPSPSPFRASPAPSTITANTSGRTTPQPNSAANPLRLHASITPALFANELEYLYTGQGFGEAFEFLFDSSHESGGLLGLGGEDEDIDAEELRIDKLRKDLVFMWRSRLYSDVKIALHVAATSSSTAKEAISSSGNKEHESTTAVFSTHKFILASRSAYFRNLLSSSPSSSKALVPATPSSKPSSTYFIDPTTLLPTLTLPSPPFTPASLHFTLGYLYTGTLAFSHRTYDLSTAFAIFLSARHLNLRELEEEVRARIIMEMAHGLFHAFLSFPEYERVTGGVWGSPALPVSSAHGHHHSLSISSLAGVTSSHTSSTRGGSGCRCKPCSRRAPRILQFALSLPSSQSDIYLDRGARRALVGLYGEGWVTQEYASLSARVRESVGRGVRKRVWGVDATTTGTTGNAKDGKDGVGKDSGSTTRGPGDKPQTQTQSHVKASTKTKTKSRGRANGNVFRILWAGEAALNGKLAQKGGNGSQQVSFAHGNSGTINGRRTLTNDDDPMGMGNGVSVGVGGPDRAPWLEIVRSDLIKGRDACDEYLAERCEEAFRVPREIRRLLRRDVVDGFDNDRDGDVKMDDVEDQQDDKEGLENEDEEDVAQEWYDILMRGSVIASSFGPGVNSGATSSGHGHPSSIASYPSTSYSTLTSSLPGYGSSYPADQLYTDSLHLTQIVSSVLRGLNEGNAGRVYQVLVANVLLLPNPFSSGTGGSGSVGGDGALLSGTSHVRVQVSFLVWFYEEGFRVFLGISPICAPF
ncbi:hypothetical protein D9758_011017 [Tetrapyrgos nigripes]|uniref:BTB domain-containing protein n=1 Tax=Tetrapyrgos nigripes TaxID=182062 RepID=A0A8H5GHY0_9AGAR|nr:hypothetical protein D9758_011017 [Tetrapyrgos nigripes]